jgi:hypothetical protein
MRKFVARFRRMLHTLFAGHIGQDVVLRLHDATGRETDLRLVDEVVEIRCSCGRVFYTQKQASHVYR